MPHPPLSPNRTASRETSFQLDAVVTQVLRGCGVAAIEAKGADELSVSRTTPGVHFDELCVGQEVSCQIALASHRVLYVHQKTQPMTALAGSTPLPDVLLR